MVVFEVIGRPLVAVCPSLHDRGRAKRGWVSLGPTRGLSLYNPGEITLAWLTGQKGAGVMPSGTPSRSAKANGAARPACGQPQSWRACYLSILRSSDPIVGAQMAAVLGTA